MAAWIAASLAIFLAVADPLADLPERPVAPLVDRAGALTTEQEAALIARLLEIQRRTGAQVAVAVVRTLGGLTEQDYAERLFRKWGVGQRGQDNGVLVLLATQDRRIWIEVGYGLEPVIPDGLAGEFRDRAKPAFRAGEWASGLSAVVEGIDRALVERGGEAAPVEPPGRRHVPFLPALGATVAFLLWMLVKLAVRSFPGAPTAGAGALLFGGMGLWGLVTGNVPFMMLAFLGGMGSAGLWGAAHRHRCPRCGSWMAIDARLLSRPTTFSSGQREVVARCAHCSYRQVWVERLQRSGPTYVGGGWGAGRTSWGGGGGGSSWGGFGGGRSGGGGAGGGF